MSILINKNKLTTSRVSLFAKKHTKFIKYNNYFYEFSKNVGEYPLELAIAQITELEQFDIVIISNDISSGYYVVFSKTPLRKTIFIENDFFLTQIIRFKELFDSIVILNDTKLVEEGVYQDNPSIFENITFLAIERLPNLIDSRKRALIIKQYMFATFVFGSLFLTTQFIKGDFEDSFSSINTELVKKQKLLNALNTKKEIINEEVITLPNREKQLLQLNEFFVKIDKGELK